ncbi:uncharacterized protein LOC103281600 isoform X3 [Anolis carolinensis]|uniref:uncharacterized protein LOC103281600 isoform X3 n=1 Tax=Anolis carolinensis TaxID=28377 RepID=UPI002F2B5213
MGGRRPAPERRRRRRRRGFFVGSPPSLSLRHFVLCEAETGGPGLASRRGEAAAFGEGAPLETSCPQLRGIRKTPAQDEGEEDAMSDPCY